MTAAANETDVKLFAEDFGGADVEDYFALLKPRVMSLVVFTALVGMVAAPTPIHPAPRFDRAPGDRRRRRRGRRA